MLSLNATVELSRQLDAGIIASNLGLIGALHPPGLQGFGVCLHSFGKSS